MFSKGLQARIEDSIRQDEDLFKACEQLAHQKNYLVDDVIADLAEFMTVRINYRRKDDLTWLGQTWEGITHVTRATVKEQHEKFRVKYGLSYEQSQSLSNDLVKDYLAALKTPGQAVWDTLRPILIKILWGWLGVITKSLLGPAFALPQIAWQ